MSPSPRASFQAFTLVEMLVVLGIIAILLGAFIPLGQYAWESAKRTEARATIFTLQNALQAYRMEYGSWMPAVQYSTNGDGDILVGWSVGGGGWSDVLAVLSGYANSADGYSVRGTLNNPRRKVFLELAQLGFTPVTQNSSAFPQQELLDPWQKPYRMMLDGNDDGALQLPTPWNGRLRASIAVWSDGNPEDKNPKPVTSWKSF